VDVLPVLFPKQALSGAEHERSTLQEKLGGVARELEAALMDQDRIKRDLQARVDQQLNAINALQADLKNFKAHLDDVTYVHQLNYFMYYTDFIYFKVYFILFSSI